MCCTEWINNFLIFFPVWCQWCWGFLRPVADWFRCRNEPAVYGKTRITTETCHAITSLLSHGIHSRKHKDIFVFCIISQCWDGEGQWNPPMWKWGSVYPVNTMAADGLVRQGARASAAIVLTLFSRAIPVSASQRLNHLNLFSKCQVLPLLMNSWDMSMPVFFGFFHAQIFCSKVLILKTLVTSTVLCRYNASIFFLNPCNRHPIARPLGRGMGFLLWIQHWYSAEFLQSFMQYLIVLDRVVIALDCNLLKKIYRPCLIDTHCYICFVGLAPDYSNSIANTLELLLSCTEPLVCLHLSEPEVPFQVAEWLCVCGLVESARYCWTLLRQ